MDFYNVTGHQRAQIELINMIEVQANTNSMRFSTVDPVDDYRNDSRIALTSVHFPEADLIKFINGNILDPLKKCSPNHYYYPTSSLHLTIKNVRMVCDPPDFDAGDVLKVKKVFTKTIPRHKKFKTYFYRLLLFPANLALVGTTDPELDFIHLDLDKELKKVGVPDNKRYLNAHYFFCNMTLVRFTSPITQDYKEKINELSHSIYIDPYEVNSVTLLSCNAAMNKQQIFGTWKLK